MMLRFVSMRFNLVGFHAIAFLFCLNAYALDLRIPEDPFPMRYEKASDIVLATVEKLEPVKVDVTEFHEFDKKFIQKGTLKIERGWKGQKRGKIDVYFVRHTGRDQGDVNLLAKLSPFLSVGRKFLLYVREIGGQKISEERFGSIVISGGKPNDELVDSETKALDRLNKGEKMDAVVKDLSVK